MSADDARFHRRSTVAAILYSTLLLAPIAILSRHPDPSTRVGRHVWAGALGIVALCIVEILIALFPYRKGEAWASWALIAPFIVLGIPIFVMDATYAPPETRLATLAPMAVGLIAGTVFVIRAIQAFFRSRSKA